MFRATETLVGIADSTIAAENISNGSQETPRADNTSNTGQLVEESSPSVAPSVSSSESNLEQRYTTKLFTVHHSKIRLYDK